MRIATEEEVLLLSTPYIDLELFVMLQRPDTPEYLEVAIAPIQEVDGSIWIRDDLAIAERVYPFRMTADTREYGWKRADDAVKNIAIDVCQPCNQGCWLGAASLIDGRIRVFNRLSVKYVVPEDAGRLTFHIMLDGWMTRTFIDNRYAYR